jgi:hypothetical protein
VVEENRSRNKILEKTSAISIDSKSWFLEENSLKPSELS